MSGEARNSTRRLKLLMLALSLSFVSCASGSSTSSAPEPFVDLNDWPQAKTVADEAHEVCKWNDQDFPTTNQHLCNRWRKVEAYGESVNAWIDAKRWWMFWR